MTDTSAHIPGYLFFFAAAGAWVILRGCYRRIRDLREAAKAIGWSEVIRINFIDADAEEKYSAKLKTEEPATEKESRQIREAAMKALQIDFRLDESDGSERPTYHFTYQTGAFFMKTSPLTQVIVMPYVYSADLSETDCVRIACNELNAGSQVVTAYYNVEEEDEEGKALVWCSLSAPVAHTRDYGQSVNDLRNALRMLFGAREVLSAQLSRLIEKSAERHVSDIERDYYSECHLSSVLEREEAMHGQPPSDVLVFGEDNGGESGARNVLGEPPAAPTLAAWLRGMELLAGAQLLSLRVVANDRIQAIYNEEEIAGYRLHCALASQPVPQKAEDELSGKGLASDVTKGLRTATLLLAYRLPGDTPEEQGAARQLTLVLEETDTRSETDGTLHYRLTYSMPRKDVRKPYTGAAAEEREHPLCGTMAMSANMRTAAKAAAEFRYLLAEAKEASRKGEKLTVEQREMVLMESPDDAYDTFWGNRLMQRGDYFNAALHFQRCWHRLSRKTAGQKGRVARKFFSDLSYRTGLCLNRLGLHRTAFFYLNACNGTENPDHVMEQINCLIGAKDYRAAELLEEVLKPLEKRMKQCADDGDDIPPAFTRLHNFLRRRRVYLHIEYGQIGQAERECHAMLDEPENADFALGELARIQKLREEQKGEGEDA